MFSCDYSKTWFAYLNKHFQRKKWKKYYKKIIFFILSIECGIKPSFMWDFGPNPINPEKLSLFLQDLKICSLISSNIIVISIGDEVFISNASHLLLSLELNILIMDISKKETEWTLHKKNKFVTYVTEYLKQNLKVLPANGRLDLKLTQEDCVPAVFGLLLGYPLIYYYNLNYPTLSLSLKLYEIKCKFSFCNKLENIVVSSFSIPEMLVNPEVESLVNKWFNHLNNAYKIVHEELKLECSFKYVNSLNL